MTNQVPSKTSFLETFAERAIIFICLGLGGWWLQNQWDATKDLHRSIERFQLHVDDKYVDKEFVEQVMREGYGRFDRVEAKLDKAMTMIREINTGEVKPHTHFKEGRRVSP